MSKRSPTSTTDWENVADWYDRLVGEQGSEFHQKIVLPGVLRLLNAQREQKALDIACGQGVLCRLLASAGVKVVGIDAARALIAAARKHGGEGIEYHVADARELAFLPDQSFDLAACVLAIQNIHPIQPVFDHVSRTLKPGGKFVMVMMHPSFRITGQSAWGWDEEKKIQYRRIDSYLIPRKTPIVTHPGQRPDVYTWTFHKPLEAYVKAMSRAGLAIDALEEWPSHKTSTSGPRASAENTARKEIPMFMALRAVKISTSTTDGAQIGHR
jgi:ubiquinone/menaquinone biosynthesis C-methylase UbiE